MKIIFLDIDGVLNVIPQGWDKFGAIFHKNFIDNLRNIIEKTGAKIVISSSWKSDGIEKLRKMWIYRNYPGEIYDVTPYLPIVADYLGIEYYDLVKRGHEIHHWLEHHPEVENYVIIDDDSDMLDYQMKHFVKTSNNRTHEDCVDLGFGLTKKCSERAIKILNK